MSVIAIFRQSGDPTSTIPKLSPFTVNLLEYQRRTVTAQEAAPKAVPHRSEVTFFIKRNLRD
jgi:hypothetical protein